jgi:hypothetical protein
LTRFAAYLRARGLLDDVLEQEVDAEIAAAVERFEAAPPPDPLRMFDHAYGQLPPDLQRQRTAMAERLLDGHRPAPAARLSSPPCAVSGLPGHEQAQHGQGG